MRLGGGEIKRRALGVGLALLFLAILTPCSTFAAPPAKAKKPANEECLACHGDATLSKEIGGKRFSLFVNPGKFKDSIHGAMFACVDCHTDLKSAPHDGTPAKVSCASCHADQQAAYDRSFH